MTSGHALGVEAKLGGSYKQESEPNDGEQNPDPALEPENLGLEFLRVHGKDLGRDDRALATPNPTCSGRAMVEKVGSTLFAHKVTKPVVVGAAARVRSSGSIGYCA